MHVEKIVQNAQVRLATFAYVEPEAAQLPRLTVAQIAALIDHTALKADSPAARIHTLCQDAAEYHFASVCVNPTWVVDCHARLAGSSVAICTVIGFPLGATLTAVKVFETNAVIEQGATEVDMVLNIGALRSGDYALVLEDIRAVVEAAHKQGALVKVIFENCLLTDAEKAIAAALSVEAGADFVKTSTGFSTGGATVQDVALMRHMVGADIGVKAAGGVQTYLHVQKMVAAGASRIGASAGLAIIGEL